MMEGDCAADGAVRFDPSALKTPNNGVNYKDPNFRGIRIEQQRSAQATREPW